MSIAEIFLIGVGLSMDAFAVSVCKGLNMHGTLNWRDTGLLALFFGGFQALGCRLAEFFPLKTPPEIFTVTRASKKTLCEEKNP